MPEGAGYGWSRLMPRFDLAIPRDRRLISRLQESPYLTSEFYLGTDRARSLARFWSKTSRTKFRKISVRHFGPVVKIQSSKTV